MSVVLDHLVIPVRDRHTSAAFVAWLLDATQQADVGAFTPVEVGALTLKFDDRFPCSVGHYAFAVDAETFFRIAQRLVASSVNFGSSPEAGWDRAFGSADQTIRVYVEDANGHHYEFFATGTPPRGSARPLVD
ncbi:MAG: VOC family protein [Polyangiaceae bacterium]|nr:hypothetical protein [Myxococcales bacterium]MCB9586217.1 VOC family protein [Polyangiaceae bacterium]MCB9606894.1 VOC family protein [Polyangiaceae bacterium]